MYTFSSYSMKFASMSKLGESLGL